jgi:hypothetical protein
VHASYWRDGEVMQNGYRCAEHNLPCGVATHAIYGCTGLNLCMESHLEGVEH